MIVEAKLTSEPTGEAVSGVVSGLCEPTNQSRARAKTERLRRRGLQEFLYLNKGTSCVSFRKMLELELLFRVQHHPILTFLGVVIVLSH